MWPFRSRTIKTDKYWEQTLKEEERYNKMSLGEEKKTKLKINALGTEINQIMNSLKKGVKMNINFHRRLKNSLNPRKILIIATIGLSLLSKPTFADTNRVANKVKGELEWIKAHEKELENHTIDFVKVRNKLLNLFDNLEQDVNEDIQRGNFDEARKNLEFFLKITEGFEDHQAVYEIKKLIKKVDYAKFNKKLEDYYQTLKPKIETLVEDHKYKEAKSELERFKQVVLKTTKNHVILMKTEEIEENIAEEESNYLSSKILLYVENLLKNHEEWEAIKYLKKELAESRNLKNRKLTELISQKLEQLEQNTYRNFTHLSDGVYNIKNKLFVVVTSRSNDFEIRNKVVLSEANSMLLSLLSKIRNKNVLQETIRQGSIIQVYQTPKGFKYLIEYSLDFPARRELLQHLKEMDRF